MKIEHGTILGGLSTVPDLGQGIAAYRDVLGLTLVEQGKLPDALARFVGMPGQCGCAICGIAAEKRGAMLVPACRAARCAGFQANHKLRLGGV